MLKIGFLKEKLFRKIEISSFKTQNFIWAKNSQISAFKSNSKALNLRQNAKFSAFQALILSKKSKQNSALNLARFSQISAFKKAKFPIFKQICLNLISFYQRFLSPLKPRCCRYYPSCSEFAKINFEQNGILRGFAFSFFRILRCNPYFKGGFDYVKVPKERVLQRFYETKALNFSILQGLDKAKVLNFSILQGCKFNHQSKVQKLKILYIPCDERRFYALKIVFKGQK